MHGRKCFLMPAHSLKKKGISLIRTRKIGVQFNGSLKFRLRMHPVPVVLEINQSQENVSFRELSVQFERLERVRANQVRSLANTQSTPNIAFAIGISQSSVSPRVTRVDANGLLKVFDGLLDCGGISFAGVVIAEQVGVIRLGVDGASASEALPLLRRQLNLDLTDDSLRYLALHDQHILRVALVYFGPQLSFGLPANQLGSHLQPIAGALNGTFDDGVNVQLARDLRQGL